MNILGYLILFSVVTFFLNYLTKSINIHPYLNHIHLNDSTGNLSIVELSSIFIGAFVGVLGIILSISYTTVTNNVRRLILNDYYIQIYLKIMIYSLFFITVNSLLFHNNSDIFLFIFSIIMIVSFIPIFIYLLELLSPVKNIENNLSRKIKDDIKKATFNGQNSKKILNYFNINCLNHEKELKNRLEVENYLEVITEIIQDIINYKKYNNKELSQISELLLNTVKYYYNLKFKININNCWFKFSKKYDDWIFYDFRRLNDISEAKKNKTDVSFKKIKDYNWFENDILRIIEKIITELINKKDYEELINILEVFENFFNHNLDYSFSINFIILLQNILNSIMYENSRQIVNVVDIIGLIYVKFIKTFMEKISYYNLKSFNSYESVDWYDFNDILKYDVPIESYDLIKTIPDYLNMEISIEDEIITNNHFITECIFKSYYFATEKSIALIIDTDEYFQELIIKITNNNDEKYYNIYHIL